MHYAAEQVAQVAEERHKAVVTNLSAAAEEHHRSKMAQREANRAFEVQAKGHAEAIEKADAGSQRWPRGTRDALVRERGGRETNPGTVGCGKRHDRGIEPCS